MSDTQDVEALVASSVARRLSDALRKVRPLGGSELFMRVGDEFYADPEFCGKAIEELRQSAQEDKIGRFREQRLREAAASRVSSLEANSQGRKRRWRGV